MHRQRSGCTRAEAPHVRVWLAFHAAPNETVAKSVCAGGFAILAQLDAGFFAQVWR